MKVDRISPRLQIRKATLADIPFITSVLYESFVEFESAYTPAAFAATTPSCDQLRARWNEGPVWIAVSTNVIIGTVAAVVKQDGLYVRSMAVSPIARGHNIGRLLLKEVETYAVVHHCPRIFLSTTPFLTQAIRLYERSGFQRGSDGPHDLFGTPLFTMEKRLTIYSRIIKLIMLKFHCHF